MGDKSCPICGKSDATEKIGVIINSKGEFVMLKCRRCNQNFSSQEEKNPIDDYRVNILQTVLTNF
ncbi:hypothetical protein KAU40_01940 [Candidatus Parcubacteria bacterium]|nr:hypothetical protein [Candidatus Parcubacteria bacterium]